MCHGLSDFSAPSGASVSRFGVEMYETGATFVKPLEQGSGSSMCSIVCRNTIASRGSLKLSTSSRRKLEFCPRSTSPCVLEGFGVGVDPDHVGGGPGQDADP